MTLAVRWPAWRTRLIVMRCCVSSVACTDPSSSSVGCRSRITLDCSSSVARNVFRLLSVPSSQCCVDAPGGAALATHESSVATQQRDVHLVRVDWVIEQQRSPVGVRPTACYGRHQRRNGFVSQLPTTQLSLHDFSMIKILIDESLQETDDWSTTI